VKVCPAIVILPERLFVLLLASTVKLTVPLPLPLLEVWSQLLVVLAVHEHPLDAVMTTLPLAVLALTLVLLADSA
jgi:hypothetical protein